MQRRSFIERTAFAAGAFLTADKFGIPGLTNDSKDYQVRDLHVHLTDRFTIDKVMEIAKRQNVKFGIVEHPADWALKDDNYLRAYISKLRKYPVHIGLQPMTPGWKGRFSPELLKQVDYILMDPQTIPMPDGGYQSIYELQTYVDDTEAFMTRYMNYSLKILKEEPINIFAWPLFLPVCIARDYYTLWTEKRMSQLIEAAAARKIAIEINDMSHTPHEKFILMAKEAGLKFTFGSDDRIGNAGRLVYCKAVAAKCKLKEDDFYIPKSTTPTGK